MQDITYRALPFPLPESCQRTLKMLSANVQALYADPTTKTVATRFNSAYVQALTDIDAYVASLRASIGFDHTRPAIRPHQ